MTAANYTDFLTLCRWRSRLATHFLPNFTNTLKVALLGGATTEMLEAPLMLALEAIGLGCRIHRSEYNSFAQEMLDATSATAEFKPEVAIVVSTPANLPSWLTPDDNLERVCQLVDEVCNYWLGLAV
ncbi:MAG: hypothetical protein FVQ84_22650 [Planctomycetes bacterium]|nr:hypothetical protein [Planctomycetota bacterium]